MPTDDLVFEPAVRLVERIRSRELSAVEVLEAHVRRVEAVNPAINAFVTTAFERARSEARAADERLARHEPVGPLHGLPVSIKDAINTAGLRTVAGSKVLAFNVPEADAPAVRRLREAGAIVLGKTNVPECAMDWRTANPVFGRTSNPWNVGCVAGGSSGGEAAAVAAGCSAGGLGTDLGGSIRVPAHFCGVFGLRPTPGRVPGSGFALSIGGTFALAHSFGPLARYADDLALLFRVLAGFDPCDPASVPIDSNEAIEIAPGTLRIGVCVDGGIPTTPETRQAVERSADRLASAGADVVRWTLPIVAEVPGVFDEWVLQPILPTVLDLYQGREDARGPLVRGLANLARPLSFERFLAAWSARDAVRRAILERMERRPVLLMPVCSTPAFGHDQRGPLDVNGHRVDYAVSFGYSQLASVAGLPALSVPAGLSSAGLPIGVQVVGRPFEEPLLLGVARLLEQIVGPFHRPPI